VKSKSQNNKKSHQSNTESSQLDQANAVLIDLSKNVTTDDRKAIIAEGILSEPHVIRYLKGNGTDLDTAMNLIRFIRKRIEERARELSRVA
jgi:hypothetical protein